MPYAYFKHIICTILIRLYIGNNKDNRHEDIKSKKVQTEPRVRDILFEKYGFWVVPTLICAPFRNVPNENNFKLIKFYQKYAQKVVLLEMFYSLWNLINKVFDNQAKKSRIRIVVNQRNTGVLWFQHKINVNRK